jgi:hypothetical protein
MKRAKQMQALARQRYERKVMKGLNDIDAGRVISHEDAMAHMGLHIAILGEKHESGAMQSKRKARSWWKHRIEHDETASDILDSLDCDDE